MLDRTKLIRELQQLSETMFVSYASEYTIARQVWQRIAQDVTFVHKIKSAQVPWPLPEWSGQLDAVIPVNLNVSGYRAISVDGSQIYPDRHQGIGCFLINVGSVAIAYGQPGSNVHLNSVPYVFMSDTIPHEGPISTEFVNCKRQEFEFVAGVHLAAQYKAQENALSQIVFFDGSLIFWQLSSKEHNLKEVFLPVYLQALEQLYTAATVCACYISLPKNRELVSLIKTALCEFDALHSDAHMLIDHVIDTAVTQFFLEPNTRSTVFKSNAAICAEYPTHLWPHFFYVHVGDEIVRVEIPAWIAADEQLVDFVAATALDQSIKGRGYPVVLAEAHEQAVVKGPDRDFFYQLIAKFGIEQKKHIAISQKSLKKRGIGI